MTALEPGFNSKISAYEPYFNKIRRDRLKNK
jgi:hypothetical protein